MFKQLSERLSSIVQRLTGAGRLTEDNISDALREVRMALLEADVALPVVREFIARVRERAVGREVTGSLTPGQALVGVVRDELAAVMGGDGADLDLNRPRPVVVLLAGLQGSGKTTTTAKLARRLIDREHKKVLAVSCDVYRPAAIDQLQRLCEQVGAGFHPSSGSDKPARIAKSALDEARRGFYDVLLVDSAGRLHVDQELMAEIRALHGLLEPAETLFVVDAMAGQDAVNAARAFNEALPLTGVVLTKTDGDARGGAALSVRHVTGAPIRFLGTGEKTDGLELFHADRVVSRILGMGDVLSLVEDVHRKVDRQATEKLARKMKKGKGFDLSDLREQMAQMQKLGGLGGLVDKLPGAGKIPEAARGQMDDSRVRRMMAIIDSMTPQERRFPAVIKGSRKRRIAMGSGTQVQEVNRLLKQHQQMSKMMKKFGKGGMSRMLKGMQGRMPPGGFPGM